MRGSVFITVKFTVIIMIITVIITVLITVFALRDLSRWSCDHRCSACVSCPLLPSYCCIPPWYRGPCGGLTSCSGCRHPELPTRSRDLPFGSWGLVFSVGGATSVSLSGTILPVHLTEINYKIFGIEQYS